MLLIIAKDPLDFLTHQMTNSFVFLNLYYVFKCFAIDLLGME